ncbi:uncharacterized protein LOC108095867 [Drosophila ficusphila]|uniref:uncharacterized protein LOC108095867 n=1 Tax=Drosophila ficusphila TaxID=30025 RepID=UPI0007E7F031|nr:uncharacterized protein LOC108095867 [Drosophila ficusphila]
MSGNTDKIQLNDDALAPPDWLNSGFMASVLGSYEKEPVTKVIDLTFSPATAKGDNYASTMYRARVEYSNQRGTFSKSLIIKTVSEIFAGSNLFKTEIGMYTKVLPEFERILREKGDASKLYADCIYDSLEPHQVIIFEDLADMGYAMVRDRKLTHEEIRSAYLKLAKIHAVSMKIINERPEFLKEFKDGICLVDIPYMSSGMVPFTEFLGRVPELKKYQPHFKKLGLSFIDRLRSTINEYQNNSQPGYYVLCHGDYHTRNVMFKHNKQTKCLEDCLLVDYQGCYVAPLAVDLMYSIYMLMGSELRTGELETLLNYYFSVLLETLTKIGFEGEMPTPLSFWAEMKRLRDYEFLFLSTYLPMSMGLNLGTVSEDTDNNGETGQKLKEFIKETEIMLARFERSGYFEDL